MGREKEKLNWQIDKAVCDMQICQSYENTCESQMQWSETLKGNINMQAEPPSHSSQRTHVNVNRII